jgi:hypothetical protein
MQNINELVDVLKLINNLEKDNNNSNSKEINDVIKHLIDEYNTTNKDNYTIQYVFLNKRIIKKINNIFLKDLGKYKKIKKTDKIIINDEKCAICLENFKVNQYIRKLPFCSHIYHKKCIDNWLKKDDNKSCPLCKKSYQNIFKKCKKDLLDNIS